MGIINLNSLVGPDWETGSFSFTTIILGSKEAGLATNMTAFRKGEFLKNLLKE